MFLQTKSGYPGILSETLNHLIAGFTDISGTLARWGTLNVTRRYTPNGNKQRLRTEFQVVFHRSKRHVNDTMTGTYNDTQCVFFFKCLLNISVMLKHLRIFSRIFFDE